MNTQEQALVEIATLMDRPDILGRWKRWLASY